MVFLFTGSLIIWLEVLPLKMVGQLLQILCIRNRHVIPGNIIISTQSRMMIPKTIRLNANLIALLNFANKASILGDVYPTVSAYITKINLKNFVNMQQKSHMML